MDTNALKKFAQAARNLLLDQVTSKLDVVLAEGSPARREAPKAVKDLENEIRKADRQQVIEQVAYTWFNRFTALRFMDANGYTQVRTVSPADGATRPELLSEAMAGNLPDGAPTTIQSLLDGRTPSHDPQAEAYRLLLVHTCNQWHGPMPFLFEKINHYTELLMPEDLLSQTCILAELRAVMTEDACQDVEIIGWLYQFYISEKKDEVFAGLKKNQKITAEKIPAATQLFTPHWIVRYLVENSLGRLWLLNNPQSGLAAKMDYYIAPEEPETDFLKITKPEEIRICDPAAGSGHMLTYAFDLLYAIYEEEGYDATEIPALILRHNLTGLEIDDRAGALAAFALAMKAAGKLGRRRFLRMEAKPDICVLQNVSFTEADVRDVAAVVGKDLFTDELRETCAQFEQAKNFGSLIVPKLRNVGEMREKWRKLFSRTELAPAAYDRILEVLRMAEALSLKYHVVVANPPYMGGKGMNVKLSAFAKKNYPDSRSDMFSAFIERGHKLVRKLGMSAMVTMESWMFLSSYEKMRTKLLSQSPITSLMHMPYLGKGGTSMGINFGTSAFVTQNSGNTTIPGTYCCVRYFETDEKGIPFNFPTQNERFGSISSADLKMVPGNPIIYWMPPSFTDLFANNPTVENSAAKVSKGIFTGDNNRFLRLWHEVDFRTNGWKLYDKAGKARRWFGSALHVVYWKDEGRELSNFDGAGLGAAKYFDKPHIVWGGLTSGIPSFRWADDNVWFDDVSPAIIEPNNRAELLAYLNSRVGVEILMALNPTLHYQIGDVKRIPAPAVPHGVQHITERCVAIARSDWDAHETSWDFTTLPLLSPNHRGETLADTYTTLRAHWQSMTDEMQRLEEENNRIFIDAYGLQDELTPEVPLNEITLTCNPAYRYGVKGIEADRETRLRADTMAEFLHYAVGCMFGRYNLDTPGLILANQGERLEDYLARIPEPQFMPDEDNVIPVLDENWFPDDITERFRQFLRVTFGDAHFRENLKFIEDALGKDIRKYFTKDFYTDHVKRYKKRPIYWMVSSPKGTFNALIYMHRYRGDTVSVLLNDYLREFITKLEGERARLEKLADDPTATQGQKTKALKDVAKTAKQIDELNEWERDVIFPLAQQKIEIDLDDGVKANYPKFDSALKKIAGLS